MVSATPIVLQQARCDVVTLAHFSTVCVVPSVRVAIDAPMFTAPRSAVVCTRALVEACG